MEPNREYRRKGIPNSKAQLPGQGDLLRAPHFLYAIPIFSASQDLGWTLRVGSLGWGHCLGSAASFLSTQGGSEG